MYSYKNLAYPHILLENWMRINKLLVHLKAKIHTVVTPHYLVAHET